MQQSDEEGRIPKNAREGVSGDSSAATEVVADGSIPHSNVPTLENKRAQALPSQSDDTDSQSSTDSAETYSTDSRPPLQESLDGQLDRILLNYAAGEEAIEAIRKAFGDNAFEAGAAEIKDDEFMKAKTSILALITAETARARAEGARAVTLVLDKLYEHSAMPHQLQEHGYTEPARRHYGEGYQQAIKDVKAELDKQEKI